MRAIVVGWLAAITVVRFGELGGAGVGWSAAAVAFLAAEVAVQSLYIFFGRRLRGTVLGWSVVAAQAVLTYLPILLFGQRWMPGNSGFLLGAVLLTAGPVAGLPLAIGITAAEVVFTYTVFHMTQMWEIGYAVTAPVDNGVQFWGLATLAQVAADLRAERGELARLAVAEERSRAERTLRDAFGRLLASVEEHVERALQSLEASPSQAANEVAAAVRTARECQAVVRSAADHPAISEPHLPGTADAPKPPGSTQLPERPPRLLVARRNAATPRSPLTGQLIAVLALGLLLLAYLVQGILDALDRVPTSLAVTGGGAMILAAIVALWRRQGELPEASRRVAACVRVVAIAGLAGYPAAFVLIAALSRPPLGVSVGTGLLVAGVVLVNWRGAVTWVRLLALVVGSAVLTMVITPDIYGSGAEALYYLAASAAVGVNSFGMVRLVQLEGALARTRRRAVTLAALRERTRVARDVHDLLGLGITTIVLKGELAARLLDTDPERARTHLAEMLRLASEAADAASVVVGAGSEPSVRAELLSAERSLTDAGIVVDVRTADGPVPGLVDVVFGVVLREAITNVLRHSTAEKVRIALGFEAGRVLLQVENDGLRDAEVAAMAEPVATTTGRGLRNIAARVAEAGGEFDAGSADGWFRLAVDLPV